MLKFRVSFLLISGLFCFALGVSPALAESTALLQEMPANSQRDASFDSSPVVTAPVAIVPAVTAPIHSSIQETELGSIDPETIGLLSSNSGGLGAALWNDTPRILVDRLLPEMSLPTASATLNDLARRLLLTTAAVPKGKTLGERSLTALRAEKLLALGNASEAWQLVQQTKGDVVDNMTLRLLVEAMMIGEADKTVCDQVPSLMASNNSPEWQKILIVCQLRAGNTSAVQLSLDVMREQAVRDDIFISLINRNILMNNKKLPRQLTPMRPINLALLRQIDLPLPPELFARPDASLIPQLLLVKASDENARLGMAEKAASRGQISSKMLGASYASAVLTQLQINNAQNSTEANPIQRAALYQMLVKAGEPQVKIEIALKFMSLLSPEILNGTIAATVADKFSDIPARSDYNIFAVSMAKLFVLAGQPERAMGWYKLARTVAQSDANAAQELHRLWPMLVLSGLVTDSEYGQSFASWLDVALKDADRAKRQQVGSTLLLLAASGFSIPEEAWGRTADTATDTKRVMPPSALLLERLRLTGPQERRGEAVVLGTLLASAGGAETPLFVLTDVIRALRQTGLVAEARSLARESAAPLLAVQAP